MEEHEWRNEHEKKPNGNYGRDKTEVWEVELFNVPMVLLKGGAKNCRGATDSVHCRVWWKDKFSQFRVFRNCGRSAKRNATIGWSMLLSWCIGFFPPLEKKNFIESLRKLCEEPDCMFSENCVVWTATWVLTPINVVSSPLPSSLLYFLFFVTSFLKRVSSCHFPMSIFHNVENTFEKWEHNIFFLL